MIILKNISKEYNGTLVLENYSLTINSGDKLCIMGRSGIGKTTLLRIISGLEAPSEGTVEKPDGLKIACVFQENRLIENLTAEKNIRLCADCTDILPYAIQIGLTKADLKKPVSQLSGGQKRRIAILRAVLYESDILIFDELLQGLDKETEAQALLFVNNNLNGRALLAVTHSEQEAKSYGAKVVEINM